MKLLDKILDDYYARRFLDPIKREVEVKYNLDVEIVKKKSFYLFRVKRPKFNDVCFREIYSLSVKRAFVAAIRYEAEKSFILEEVKYYLKYNR